MMAAIPADVLSSFAEAPTSVGTETPDDTPAVDDAPAAEPADTTPADEAAVEKPITEPATDDSAPDAAAPDTPPAADAEELEEGIVRSKDSKGKFKYNLEENRYKTVYGNHQLVQKANEILGEPLTIDGIEHLQQVSTAHDRLWDHMTSGDPAQQSLVVKEFINEMKQAQTSGETGVDPTIPFATTVYEALRDSSPDGFAHLRLQGARDLLSEMFESAAANNNQALFGSAQHIAAALLGIGPKPANVTDAQYVAHIQQAASNAGIPFHTLKDMGTLVRTEEPLSAAERRIQELESQLNQRSGTSQTEQFSTWSRANQQTVNTAVYDEAVKPILSAVEDAWKDFPDDYQGLVVDRLNGAVTKALAGDQDLIRRTKELRARAQRATSEQVRADIGAEIQKLYVNRAKLAVDGAKAPILKSAATALKGLSVQNNSRRAAAQTRTAPQGTGTPVRQSVLPTEGAQFKNNMFDRDAAVKQAMSFLNAGR